MRKCDTGVIQHRKFIINVKVEMCSHHWKPVLLYVLTSVCLYISILGQVVKERLHTHTLENVWQVNVIAWEW